MQQYAEKIPFCLLPCLKEGQQSIEDENTAELRIAEWLQIETASSAAGYILQLVTFLMPRALPKSWPSRLMHMFRPFLISGSPEDKFLIFLERDTQSYVQAVLKALTADEFHDLKRVWCLADPKIDGSTKIVLPGKRMMFGPSMIKMLSGCQQHTLKVHSPLRDSS
jgi:hypothetical protein